jgi:hypothetical protein
MKGKPEIILKRKMLNYQMDVFITVSELEMDGTSIALPISIGLTTCATILRSTSGLIAKKISKHSEIELLAKAKLNSIEEKFTKAIKDGKITDDEFKDNEQEIKAMKA